MIKLFARTFSYMKPVRGKYLAGSALASFELLMLLAIPIVNRMLVEMIMAYGSGETLRNMLLIMAGLLALTPLVAVGRYWQGLCAQKTADNIKKALFSHIQRLPLGVLGRRKSGDYLLLVSNDADRAGGMFGGFAIVSLLRFVVITAVTMVLLFFADWRIAVLALVYNLVCFGLSLLVNPYVNKLERAARQEIAASSNVVLETMRSMSIVRVFALGAVLGQRYRLRCEAVRKKRAAFRAVNGMAYGVMDIFSFSAQAVGFLAAIFFLARGEMALSQAVYVASLMALASDAMLRLSTFILLIQPPLVAARRIFEIMDEPAQPLTGEGYSLNSDYAVVLKGVDFAYPDGTVALQNIDISIKNGEHVAFVGGSGSGKTTLAQVIASLYTPNRGEIVYFGVSNR
ncbi:MAG: ABC transporter ATP-binding protein/permease, partial [Defluviitaleaceae bacterium]|nr:ABC transporter ATP-binding protein/permease [Defluviitaleaceae bacterium]